MSSPRSRVAQLERRLETLEARLAEKEGEKREPLSMAKIRAMTPQEAAERMDEIDAWQAAGMPEPDDD